MSDRKSERCSMISEPEAAMCDSRPTALTDCCLHFVPLRAPTDPDKADLAAFAELSPRRHVLPDLRFCCAVSADSAKEDDF